MFRLNVMPEPAVLKKVAEEFADILTGPIEACESSPREIYDDDVPQLPRIKVPFDQTHFGRLRLLIDRLNELSAS